MRTLLSPLGAATPVIFVLVTSLFVGGATVPSPDRTEPAASAARVFPATAIQRGQALDRRRTHRHAGVDLAGECGSPIVASMAGVVLRAPGRDKGYGPMVRVVRGDDGLVYRYAHLAMASADPGQRVATAEQIGTMGRLNGGRCHLHFEIIPGPEYDRRPYGVHSLNPNAILGGERGSTIIAAEPIPPGPFEIADLSGSVVPQTGYRFSRRARGHHRHRHKHRRK